MNRKIFKLPFTEEAVPSWQCPTCQTGFLRIKEGTFFSEETSLSKKAHDHEAWDPDWISSVYSCLLECLNKSCKEIISNTGKGFVDWDIEQDEHGYPVQVYCDFYKPLFFHPHLKLISVPENAPGEVKEKLNESFRLFFSSPSAASNHVRAAIESLLNNLNVNRYRVSNGKRRLISLHQRIDLLPSKHAELKDLLIAVKWLGNAGSHSGKELSADDVMDAYEIVEHVLSEIYEKKSVKLKALAKKVNKAKGPKN